MFITSWRHLDAGWCEASASVIVVCMASDFVTRTAVCPICGERMTATVELKRGWGSDEVLARIVKSVSCPTGCEHEVGDNRSRMLEVFRS
jgi:hypothetical protein